MSYGIPRGESRFEPRDPQWDAKVRDSFTKQGVMGLMGATLADVWPGGCEIHINLIPHTVQHTALHTLTAGSAVNLEIDLIARYVERMLSSACPESARSY